MGSYAPPRRESIAEHLEVARQRWHEKLPPWPEGAISATFVEDLVRERLINGPGPVKKAHGRGRGRRFAPRDYRDLLEVIKLKLSGVKHRGSWLFHLWLRGHEYDIEDVRRALIDDLQTTIQVMMRDLAPTGRFTEQFGVKFDRRVRQAEGADEGMADIIEALAAKMVRPQALQEITPNAERMATDLAGITNVDIETLRPAIFDLVEAAKGAPTISPQSAKTLFEAFTSGPFGDAVKLMLSAASHEEIAQLDTTLHGAIDDGKGNSKLVDCVRTASESKLKAVRRFWRAAGSGQLEESIRKARAECPAEALPILDMLEWMMRQQRRTNRNNPRMTAYVFSNYLLQW